LSISVVIPAYNEAGAVAETVGAVRTTLAGAGFRDFEVVVVDDGSTDRTAREAEHAGARVIVNVQNLGYGASLKRGITAAKNDTVMMIDADMTYPVEAMPALISLYQKGFDMVVGQRTGQHYEESWLKSTFRLILKWLVEFTAGRKIPDINSGLRIFSKKTIIEFFPHLCDTFSFSTSMTLGYMMTGKFVAYLPVSYAERRGQAKVRLLRDSMRTLQYIVEAILYYNPIKIFIVLSGFLITLSLLSFVLALLTHILVFYVLGAGALLFTPLIFALGLLAMLLKQILAAT
jgi:glycosyltransferase involved in cell wall biosynthesis